jgi:hypothetical protein
VERDVLGHEVEPQPQALRLPLAPRALREEAEDRLLLGRREAAARVLDDDPRRRATADAALTPTATRPPSGVNLSALARRLVAT